MDQLYEMNPSNVTSNYNVAMSIHRSAQDLDMIAGDVRSIRNSIWANTFLNVMNMRMTVAQNQYMNERISAIETRNLIDEITSELGAAVSNLGSLVKSAYSRGKELQRLHKEFTKVGIWFLSDMDFESFVEKTTNDYLELSEGMEPILNEMEAVNEEFSLDEETFDAIRSSIVPKLDELARGIASVDFRFEISVSILKGCIGLKRLDNRYGELIVETEEVRAKLEAGEIQLPFKLDTLNRAMEISKNEVAEFREIGQRCKEEQILIYGEPEEMTAWREDLEHQASVILESYTGMLDKFVELKHLYEAYWIKNN
jgi:hypothetical protein